MILVSNMLKHEKFQKFQVSSIPKKTYCITLVGKFWMLAFPICPEIYYFNLKENPLSKPSKEV